MAFPDQLICSITSQTETQPMAAPTLNDIIQAFQTGQLAQAEQMCTALLAQEPENADALHILGGLQLQRGAPSDAVSNLSQAVALAPSNPLFLGNLGMALLETGAIDEAITQLNSALAADPNHLDARYNLGNAYRAKGEQEAAISEYAIITEAAPDYTEAWNNLALCHAESGRTQQAIEILSAITEKSPQDTQARTNLGKLLLQLGQPEDAITQFDAALALTPQDGNLHNGRSAALIDAGRFEEAEAAVSAILQAAPDNYDALLNKANLCTKQGLMEKAAETFKQIIALYPDAVGTLSNYADILWRQYRYDDAEKIIRRALDLKPTRTESSHILAASLAAAGRFDEALSVFDAAIERAPDFEDTIFHRAILEYGCGKFEAGARDYRARLAVRNEAKRIGDERLADDLSGATVIVERDQGLGDEIFFLRFMAEVRRRGARTCYIADPRLVPMLQRADLADEIVGTKQEADGDIALHVGDLPYATDLKDNDELPPPVIIPPDPDRVAVIQQRLADFGPPPYIGVTWRAGTAGRRDAIFKEVPAEDFASTLKGINGTFIALQRLPAPGEIEEFSAVLGAPLHDLTALNEALEDIFALSGLLDEYVCVSNTNVHFRTAQGKSCRVLVPHPPEFRWMVEGNESPWFPGTGIYRQSRDGDWSAALTALKTDLSS